MFYSAFQSNAFQSSAYQIALDTSAPVLPASGGGGPVANDWKPIHVQEHEYRIKQLQKERQDAQNALALREKEIEALELRRLKEKRLADRAMQENLLAMMIEAKRLEDERIALEALIRRYMIEEDDIMVILMCLPFIN